MRIADNSMGTGIAIEREEGDSQELNVIATRIMPEWLALFQQKNRDYGSGSAYELGVRGQYSDIHRKMIKLKRAMWDGHDLDFEDTDEIIKDLISHLFLTLHMFGLQREAAAAYIYTEDDAAVDAFFRMVGGDAENALKMSGVLTAPFKDLVRSRAHALLAEEQAEHAAAIGEDASDAEHARNGAREARRRAREADGSPGRLSVAALAEKGLYGFRVVEAEEAEAASEAFDVQEAIRSHKSAPRDGYEAFATEDYMHGDYEQNGQGFSAELKVGPARIVTEQVDGIIRYYHEPYPGADREPLALVPKALIDRAQKDHHVLSKEQEAGLRTLADWADRS